MAGDTKLDLNDLYAYDPVARSWTNLSVPAAGVPPSRRDSHGFAAAGGLLYVHGGESSNGAQKGGMRAVRVSAVSRILNAHAPGYEAR